MSSALADKEMQQLDEVRKAALDMDEEALGKLEAELAPTGIKKIFAWWFGLLGLLGPSQPPISDRSHR